MHAVVTEYYESILEHRDVLLYSYQNEEPDIPPTLSPSHQPLIH